MKAAFLSIMVCATLVISPAGLHAQHVAIQQPVIEVFGVDATVVVPDRGGAILGGVGSAASGRSQFGPFRSGYALGASRQRSTVSAHVYIHDFEAMDRALLAGGKPKLSSRIDPRILQRIEQQRRAATPVSRRR